MDSSAAKQFLISRVIEQAELEQVALSDIEKKMLQFTERNRPSQTFMRSMPSSNVIMTATSMKRRSRDC